jgi:hypothetical protein
MTVRAIETEACTAKAEARGTRKNGAKGDNAGVSAIFVKMSWHQAQFV